MFYEDDKNMFMPMSVRMAYEMVELWEENQRMKKDIEWLEKENKIHMDRLVESNDRANKWAGDMIVKLLEKAESA